LASALLSTQWGGKKLRRITLRISDENAERLDQVLDVPSSGIKNNLWMEEYLIQSNSRLETIAEQFNRGEQIDCDSRAWMLNQVDFIVESLGTDSAELDNSLRSSLLQLILAIANLNHRSRYEIQPVPEES
jgi:hypothetical protein